MQTACLMPMPGYWDKMAERFLGKQHPQRYVRDVAQGKIMMDGLFWIVWR